MLFRKGFQAQQTARGINLYIAWATVSSEKKKKSIEAMGCAFRRSIGAVEDLAAHC